jgi:hypothetical protein
MLLIASHGAGAAHVMRMIKLLQQVCPFNAIVGSKELMNSAA